MLQKLKETYHRWATSGMHWPFVHDPVTKKPSVTLMMFYITFVAMLASLVGLYFSADLLTASCMAMLSWVLGFIFYRLRHLDKVKIDLDDKSIELEDKGENDDE